LINYSRGILPLVSDSQEDPDVDMVKPRRRLFNVKSKPIRKIQGNALAFHFAPEQPMNRRNPHAGNGKGGKQTGMLARGQAWSRSGRGRLKALCWHTFGINSLWVYLI